MPAACEGRRYNLAPAQPGAECDGRRFNQRRKSNRIPRASSEDPSVSQDGRVEPGLLPQFGMCSALTAGSRMSTSAERQGRKCQLETPAYGRTSCLAQNSGVLVAGLLSCSSSINHRFLRPPSCLTLILSSRRIPAGNRSWPPGPVPPQSGDVLASGDGEGDPFGRGPDV